jgi:hypothetical protein
VTVAVAVAVAMAVTAAAAPVVAAAVAVAAAAVIWFGFRSIDRKPTSSSSAVGPSSSGSICYSFSDWQTLATWAYCQRQT